VNRLEAAYAAYFQKFYLSPPEPMGVSDDVLAHHLERAVAKDKPIPNDFDWYFNLPPSAVV